MSLAASYGVSWPTIQRHLLLAGVEMRTNNEVARTRRAPVSSDLVARYAAGESEKALAESLGVSRNVIRRCITEAGVPVRGRSEAQALRLAHLGVDGRQRLAAEANTARRGSRAGVDELCAKARTAERTLWKIRNGEIRLACFLSELGHFAELQRAVGKYNIDLAFEPLAIEVHLSTDDPRNIPRHQQRVTDLAAAGWVSIYIWARSWRAITPGSAHAVAGLIETPPTQPCLVLRGNGRRC